LKPIIGITIGDFNGIGPELAIKVANEPSIKKICVPALIGPLNIFEAVSRNYKIKCNFTKLTIPVPQKSSVPVIDVGDGIEADINYGKPTKASGRSAGAAIERAVELCLLKKIDAIVTAPASKEALHLAGYNFPGQTEMIALLSRSKQVAMFLVTKTFKVGLVTIHTGIRNVAENITKEKLYEKIAIINKSLEKDFNIRSPEIAVLALNPHAGENGLIGNEEKQIIEPAIESAKVSGIKVRGPFPADAFFGTQQYKKYDAVIAMYHDQGMIPFKMYAFDKGVNFSAGLEIIRTSPDHGTAYDIAGKNKANISSMLEAVKLAVQIVHNRKENDRT